MRDQDIESAWDLGNNAGDGFAVGKADMTPRQAAEYEEYSDIRTFDTSTSQAHCVVATDGDRLIAICDANGPWAVDITAAVRHA